MEITIIELEALIIHACNELESVQSDPVNEQDAEYWQCNRTPILEAIGRIRGNQERTA